MISTEWPPWASSLSAIFYWIFCLPVLSQHINTLTLTLYYRFLITNSHFKTFFDCISSNHCIRYLKSFKNFVTDILVVSQLDMLSAVKKTKKTINFFEAKINNKLFCSYLIFFCLPCQQHKKLLNFFFLSVFSDCAFLTLPWETMA